MSITRATFSPPISGVAEEYDLARQIEAGIYAQHLLASGSRHPEHELRQVAQRGTDAWERLWLSNLRLVAKVAHPVARRHRLPFDEVFQDGCLGLAEALMRFDFSLGWRMSTLSHEYIQRFVRASAARRAGELDGPGRQHRLRSQMRQVSAELSSQQHREPTVREIASLLGVSMAAAVGASAATTSLDEVGAQQISSDGGFEPIESHGLDFLMLLSDAGELLRLRYGLGVKPHTLSEIAEKLEVSSSSVARMERRALARARVVLEADRCREPGL